MIYFIESIPTGGKSYYAKKTIGELYGNAILYREEYHNPIDLLRQALLTENEYHTLLNSIQTVLSAEEYTEIIANFNQGISRMGSSIFLPYMHASQSSAYTFKYFPFLYEKEICDGQVDFSEYSRILLRRIQKFIEWREPDQNYIFEGAILHNPLITILGFYNLTEDIILSFFAEIYNIIKSEDYLFRYIKVNDIQQCVLYAIKKRGGAVGYNWLNGFNWWFGHSKNFCDYEGIEGIISFSNKIKELEEKILNYIPFKHETIERRIE